MQGLKMDLSHVTRIFLFFALVNGFLTLSLSAQIESYDISRAKQFSVDTLAKETSQKILEGVEGLLEKEIDPEQYILGPNDWLTICIISANSKEIDAKISPSGRLLIPEVGVVDLKGKTLAEAEILIREKVKRIYRADEIYTVIKKLRKFKVIVSGSVMQPAIVSATHVDRVSEVLEKAGGFKFDASLRNIQVIRDGQKNPISVDVRRFFALGEKDKNPFVLGGDVILVPPSSEKNIIEIFGEVKNPKEFEFAPGDSLSMLIKFAQGFLSSAYLDSVEIVRFSGEGAGIERWFVDLNSWRDILYSQSLLPGDFPLEPGDRVYIRTNPNWYKDMTVKIEGEVKYPGEYAIDAKNFRVFDLINKAGGVTKDGSLDAAILIRLSEQEIEDKQMERLRSIPPSEMNGNERRYFQARALEIKGIMTIDFENVMKDPTSDENILLLDKDSIYIPLKKAFVNVQGRVNNPGLVVYKPQYTYMDYITLAGGFGFRADEGETFIVKPNNQQFLAEDMEYKIEPGDNILVPPEKEGLSFYEVVGVAAQAATLLTVVLSAYSLMK